MQPTTFPMLIRNNDHLADGFCRPAACFTVIEAQTASLNFRILGTVDRTVTHPFSCPLTATTTSPCFNQQIAFDFGPLASERRPFVPHLPAFSARSASWGRKV